MKCWSWRYAIVSDLELREASRKLAGTFSGTSGQVGLDSVRVSGENH
jgi:hypothetical protein